ncbi:condensation domain-containing protein [Streptomyces sp. NPDC004629]|uniref:condensation domain-containing protein n=1 Tax=Streptomyces sp. NPDC004629 TaxID=3364705 RepID=UPI00368E5F63
MGFVEEQLIELWCALFGMTDVPPDTGFVALGGDKETASVLASRIDDELGVNVTPEELLQADGLGAMTRLVRTAMDARRASAPGQPTAPAPGQLAASAPGRPAVPSGPRQGAREDRPLLSFGQQRLWFMQQIDPATTLYNVPTVLRLRGPLDRAALGRALDRLVARHEVLRTTYTAPGGKPCQVIAPAVPQPLPYTDLTGRADAADEARRLAAEEAASVFDLAARPPVRARLLRLAPDDHHLMMTFHHIAVDGWSLEIFYRELGELYGAQAAVGPAPPDGPRLQYADYAAWQRAWLRGEELDALIGHWRAVLGDDPQALLVPTDHPRPGTQRFDGAVATHEIGPELTNLVWEFSRTERVTPYMTALAGFDALLAGWSGATDVTVGTPAAGRTRPELQDLVGCLINMLPVRVGLDGAPGFRTLLSRVRAAVLDAFTHQDLPFDKLVEALVNRRRRDFLPVFRVMFSYLKERQNPVFRGLDECVLDLTGPQDTAKYDLSLYVEERGERLALTLEYDTDLFGPDTPAALLTAYERTLDEAITFPETPVPKLSATRFGRPGTERSTHRDR